MTTLAQEISSADRSGNEAPGFEIEVLKGLSNFLDLRVEWDELHKRAATPHHVFQSHSFLRHWAEQYLDDKARLFIICGRVGNQLAMVWPLVVTRRFGVDVLTFMGAPTAQFFDVLVDNLERWTLLLNAGWSEISTLRADIFVGTNIRSDALIHSCTAMCPIELPGRTTAPYAKLCLRVEGEDPGPAYSARERSNYRRRLRRAAEYGEISFSCLRPGAQASALALKATSFKQRSLLSKSIWSPTVSNPKFGGFFEHLAGDPDASLRVSTINCDDKEIGIELSFDCGGHTFGHVLATDPDSPVEGIGSVLVHRAFISATARGTHTFEMMAPADQYKMPHADGETPVSNLAVAFTPKGRLYRDLYLRKVQPVAKALAQRFAAPLIARMLQNREAQD